MALAGRDASAPMERRHDLMERRHDLMERRHLAGGPPTSRRRAQKPWTFLARYGSTGGAFGAAAFLGRPPRLAWRDGIFSSRFVGPKR